MPLDPNAVPGLLAALDSPDVFVRITAAEGLGKIGDPAAIERLHATLSDPRPDVRRRVIRALQRIGTEPRARAAAQVVPGLALGLDDPDRAVRWAARAALRCINATAAREVLAAHDGELEAHL